MLVLQVVTGWAGLMLLGLRAQRLGRPRMAIALLCCGFLPIPFALMGAVIKDAVMAAALLLAVGLFAWRDARWGRAATIGAVLLIVVASAVRFNAFLAGVPLIVALLPPYWRASPVRLGVAVALVAVPLVLALPVANRLLHASPSGVELSLVIFDLGGITAASGVDAFPPQPVADPVAINRGCYDPEKWDSYAWWVDRPCPIGFDSIRAELARSGASGTRLWLGAIFAHPIAYAVHRLRHFNVNSRFIVRGDVERPVFEDSDPNPWGYRLRGGGLHILVDDAALGTAATPLGWPIWWMALAAAVLIAGPCLPSGGATAPLALSSLLYGLGYLPLSVASEMRYHLWTMTAAMLAAVIAASDIGAGAPIGRTRSVLAVAPLAAVTLIGLATRLG
jgi:hypothetical protein